MYTRVSLCGHTRLFKTLFAFLVYLLPITVGAATLQLAPASGVYEVGSTLSIAVSVRSSDQAFNAVSGTLKFSSDTLEVVSLSKGGSVISLWVQEPSYSNAAGSVSFEGIVLNPGYKGVNGKVLTVQFRVKKAGAGNVSFSSGEVLANDGTGTSILSQLGTASYSLKLAETEVAPVEETETPPSTTPATQQANTEVTNTEAEEETLPEEPLVVSQSHGLNSWSASQSGEFSFNFGPEVIAMRLLLDEKPDSLPVVLYQPPIEKRVIDDIAEGVSYLHVQTKTAKGWGDVIHYVLQVDTKAPERVEVFSVEKNLEGEKTFAFSTLDSGSGVHHYEVRLDDGETITVPSVSEKTEYTFTQLAPGTHTLYVKSFDQAGNYTETTYPFMVSEEAKESFFDDKINFGLGAVSLLVVLFILILSAFVWLAFYVNKLKKALDQSKSMFTEDNNKLEFIKRAASAQTIMSLRDEIKKDIALLKRTAKKRALSKEEEKLLKRESHYVEQADEYVRDTILDMSNQIRSSKPEIQKGNNEK